MKTRAVWRTRRGSHRWRPVFLVLVSVLLVSPPGAIGGASFQTHKVDPSKELIIIDPKVVDSDEAVYPGVLSFGHLMEQLAGEGAVETFVTDWLKQWENDQLIPSRDAIRDLEEVYKVGIRWSFLKPLLISMIEVPEELKPQEEEEEAA